MSDAVITWVGGPVLHAWTEGPFHIHEALLVGEGKLLGEVIHLKEQELVAQVYEDTTGLRPGDEVKGTGHPFSVRLGPGLLGNIYDGLLRPLVQGESQHFVQPGMQGVPVQTLPFRPMVKTGDRLEAGMPFGEVLSEAKDRQCLVPPEMAGTVETVAGEGEYPDNAPLCTLRRDDGGTADLSMTHHWPVRKPRPFGARLPVERPMITGQRVLDTLFPVSRGGRAGLPGGFGTGKTVLLENLAKWCDADVIVYVGCGERGNEMAEVLDEFPQLEDPLSGRPLMERMVIIANTSNMPVAAREASIYTGVTVAEYFRDQGQHVALLADSTSRWAEALREVSGRLGELPGEGGYPAYLSSRLAEFYERSSRVRTLSGEEGSLTIVGTVSPPAGDFSEPVTAHTKRFVRAFWALDRDRAQARFFPAIHPLQSYSERADILAPWWRRKGNPDWAEHRRRLLTLLEQQAHLERMVRIVGKDALPPSQQAILLCGELISEGFLRQSVLSVTDRFCSPERQTAMLKLIMRFIELAETAVERGTSPAMIAALPVYRRLQRMAEEIGEDRIEDLKPIWNELDDAFAGIGERGSHES